VLKQWHGSLVENIKQTAQMFTLRDTTHTGRDVLQINIYASIIIYLRLLWGLLHFTT
jgi:hypothetical protein